MRLHAHTYPHLPAPPQVTDIAARVGQMSLDESKADLAATAQRATRSATESIAAKARELTARQSIADVLATSAADAVRSGRFRCDEAPRLTQHAPALERPS
jgi:hypothetical protein